MSQCSTGDAEVDAKVTEWLSWCKNDKDNAEIRQLVQDGKVAELQSRLLNRMEFGTAGLRARMGAGYSMMNDLTVLQATQSGQRSGGKSLTFWLGSTLSNAPRPENKCMRPVWTQIRCYVTSVDPDQMGLCKYTMTSNPNTKQMGVCVGYDGRHNSKRYALLTANVFLRQGVKVYLFSKMCPTPYVAYCTRHNKCACGIMVTASHNPKEDNGYKVYWSTGAQIISPVDKGISTCIKENLEPWPTSWDIDDVETNTLRQDPFQDIHSRYQRDVHNVCYYRELNKESPVKFTFTAMHGVGYPFTDQSIKEFGFSPVIPVVEQVTPDPEFPTVKYPNPEEGKGALTLSMKTANENNSTVILANDPDADRLAVAEKDGDEWIIFTGNEIGALLGWWSWFAFRQKHPDVPASDCYMLASTVSSKILQTMAKKEGFNFEETLTGFKWMGSRAHTLMEQGKTVLFAFEEAIGFMCGSVVLDKDGVSAAAVCAEMTTYIHKHGPGSIKQQLENIYKEYGYHISSNSYFICHDPPTIDKMFEELRNYNNSGKHPTSCGQYKIQHVRDLTTGFDSSQPDKKPLLPVSKSSHMVTFTFENGCVATLRTSGTEPKIKYYTEHKPDPTTGMDKDTAQKELDDMVACIQKYFFQPEKFGLIPRST